MRSGRTGCNWLPSRRQSLGQSRVSYPVYVWACPGGAQALRNCLRVTASAERALDREVSRARPKAPQHFPLHHGQMSHRVSAAGPGHVRKSDGHRKFGYSQLDFIQGGCVCAIWYFVRWLSLWFLGLW